MDHNNQRPDAALLETSTATPDTNTTDSQTPQLSGVLSLSVSTSAHEVSSGATAAPTCTPTDLQQQPRAVRIGSPASANAEDGASPPPPRRLRSWQASSAPRIDTASARPSSMKSRPKSADSGSQIQAEYQYLVADLARQNARALMLLQAQDEKQAQLQVADSAAEARKLRKAVGFAQSQLANAEQQEQLIWMRLSDLCAQMQRRNRLAQLQVLRQQQQRKTCGSPSLAKATTGTHPRVTFAVTSPVVHDRTEAATPIPLTPFLPTMPLTPFSSPTGLAPSPMSPLAPVFQPRSMLFSANATNTAASDDQSSGPDSLDSMLVAVANATQDTLGPVAASGGGDEAAEFYEEDKCKGDENYMVASGVVDDGSGGDLAAVYFPPKSGLVRRRSHSAVPPPKNTHKRMSLPVQLSWPEGME